VTPLVADAIIARLDARPALDVRAARALIEIALDRAGRPGSLRLSRWLDALLVLEEEGR
jgi:hypothetical protein